MSDAPSTPARPVSLFTILVILALFAAFILVVRHYYRPAAQAPFNAAAENFSKDLAWKATADSRRAALTELQQAQAAQAGAYAWIDQKAGVVQLPIARAMELTARHYGSKK